MVDRDSANEYLPEINEEVLVENLKKALEEEKCKTEANLAGWQRTQADFINYKRFSEQEKLENSKYAASNVMLIMLPVLDDLERALAAIPVEEFTRKSLEGFKLIEKKFKGILEKQGLTVIKTVGQEYDCRTMEAITCGPGKKDIVIQELEKGYMLNDKVIRPAKVIVGEGESTGKEG